MFGKILKAQWTSVRVVVIAFSVIAFTIPLASVFYGGSLVLGSEFQVTAWLYNASIVGQAIPITALALGVLLGMAAWTADHAGRHVYALSLPIPRWRFVMMRFGAGATLLAAPVIALGAGASLAAMAVHLPEGVHAYPMQLTLRFALSALLMFAIFFTISIGTRRVVLGVLGTLGGMALADILLNAVGFNTSIVSGFYTLLTHWPGPLAILMGRWALFDV